jgi:hypothetical protein
MSGYMGAMHLLYGVSLLCQVASLWYFLDELRGTVQTKFAERHFQALD